MRLSEIDMYVRDNDEVVYDYERTNTSKIMASLRSLKDMRAELLEKARKVGILEEELKEELKKRDFDSIRDVCPYYQRRNGIRICRLTKLACIEEACPYLQDPKPDVPKAKILHHTPIEVLMRAIRISHKSDEKMDSEGDTLGENDKKLLEKILNMKHDSVLEHVVYTVMIDDITRALLQELARHRFVSMTVESTRFTLKKKLKEGLPVRVPIPSTTAQKDLELMVEIARGWSRTHSNDVAKYFIPEAFKTRLVMTTNARELMWIITLRSQKGVLEEFRLLTRELFKALRGVHPELWKMIAKREEWLWASA